MMHDYGNMSDIGKMALLVNGDHQAFEFIYWRHVHGLYRFAQSRLHAEEESREIVQSIFVDLWERRASLGHVTSLSPYLYRMLKNRLVEHYRHNLVKNRYIEDFSFFEPSGHNTTEDLQNLNDTKALIDESVASMPPRMQMAFRLSREENLPIAHIAQQMNISPRTAETLLTKALKRLRTSLGSTLALLIWLNDL